MQVKSAPDLSIIIIDFLKNLLPLIIISNEKLKAFCRIQFSPEFIILTYKPTPPPP